MVVTTRSHTGGSSRKVFLTLGYECSGTFGLKKPSLKRNGTASRKCQCPFKLRGRPKKNDETWKLTVICRVHNYEPYKTLVGHAFVDHLSSEEKKMVGEMVENRVKPINMLRSLTCGFTGNEGF